MSLRLLLALFPVRLVLQLVVSDTFVEEIKSPVLFSSIVVRALARMVVCPIVLACLFLCLSGSFPVPCDEVLRFICRKPYRIVFGSLSVSANFKPSSDSIVLVYYDSHDGILVTSVL